VIPRLLRIADWLERPVLLLGRAGSWLILPLVVVVLFDAIARRYLRRLPWLIEHDLHHYLNSPKLQDSEWHLHTMMFCLAIGYAYVHNAHVRLDLFRPRLGQRGRLWVEILGAVVLLLPFLAVLSWVAWDFLALAWLRDEGPANTTGLGNRWFIKSFVFAGCLLLLAATVSILIRLSIRLFGPPGYAAATRTDAHSSDTHSPFG
jgi:TRAP-type mannitol/chloroaromatic compound transport system permease small subunit